ncbi:MAG: hypothetical protein EAX96_09005 [Candidatus Lokiarchaeota archaeon]|nr:hypothetical protein [Candidatus Lokiarchaeota archaeon]
MKKEENNKKIMKIHKQMFEIFERLNLKLPSPPSISNMAIFLQDHQYISKNYASKIKSLDLISDFKNMKNISKEINDIELYLLTRFYHYI